MKKTVWTFGLIAGAVMSAMMLITMPFESQLGNDRAEVLGYTTIVAAFLLVFFGVRSYRDSLGGSISFGRALAAGALIAFVASLCYTLSWEIVSRRFYPDFVTKYRDAQIAQIQTSDRPQVEKDRRIADAKRFADLYANPVVNFAMTMIEPLPVGLVIALVSAAVLSRRRRGVLAYSVPASS